MDFPPTPTPNECKNCQAGFWKIWGEKRLVISVMRFQQVDFINEASGSLLSKREASDRFNSINNAIYNNVKF